MLVYKTKNNEKIIDAFFTILKNYTYDELQIMQLCYEADVSRQTFYNLFKTKANVVRAYVESLFNDFLIEYIKIPSHTIRTDIGVVVDVVNSHSERLLQIFKNDLGVLLKDTVVKLTSDKLSISEANSNDYRTLIFLCTGILSLVKYELMNNEAIRDKEAFVNYFIDLFKCKMMHGLILE